MLWYYVLPHPNRHSEMVPFENIKYCLYIGNFESTPLEGYVRWPTGLCDIFSTRLMCFGWRCCCIFHDEGCRRQNAGFMARQMEVEEGGAMRSTPNCNVRLAD